MKKSKFSKRQFFKCLNIVCSSDEDAQPCDMTYIMSSSSAHPQIILAEMNEIKHLITSACAPENPRWSSISTILNVLTHTIKSATNSVTHDQICDLISISQEITYSYLHSTSRNHTHRPDTPPFTCAIENLVNVESSLNINILLKICDHCTIGFTPYASFLPMLTKNIKKIIILVKTCDSIYYPQLAAPIESPDMDIVFFFVTVWSTVIKDLYIRPAAIQALMKHSKQLIELSSGFLSTFSSTLNTSKIINSTTKLISSSTISSSPLKHAKKNKHGSEINQKENSDFSPDINNVTTIPNTSNVNNFLNNSKGSDPMFFEPCQFLLFCCRSLPTQRDEINKTSVHLYHILLNRLKEREANNLAMLNAIVEEEHEEKPRTFAVQRTSVEVIQKKGRGMSKWKNFELVLAEEAKIIMWTTNKQLLREGAALHMKDIAEVKILPTNRKEVDRDFVIKVNTQKGAEYMIAFKTQQETIQWQNLIRELLTQQ